MRIFGHVNFYDYEAPCFLHCVNVHVFRMARYPRFGKKFVQILVRGDKMADNLTFLLRPLLDSGNDTVFLRCNATNRWIIPLLPRYHL